MADTITLKLEVVELDGDERRKWYELTQVMQELSNFVWRHWEAWHTQRDTSQAVRNCLDADATWKLLSKKERKKQKRPKWTVDAWPKEFANDIYHKCTARFPGLHGRVIVLALQKIRGNVVSKKSAGSNLKLWTAIMLDRDSRSSFLHPQPLPFDRANSKVRPADEKGRVELLVRVDRIEQDHCRNATSTEFAFKLKTGGKRWSYAKLAHAASRGEIELRGSQLVYDWRKKKWFACLTVDKPATDPVELDGNKVLILRPGRRWNWRIRIGGFSRGIMGRGHHVANVRKGLLRQRWSRQEGYRYAPRRKGHGTDRALEPLFKLSRRWNSFTRRMNDELTAHVIDRCLELGCGTVLLIGGDSTRRLATAGKVDGREDSTGWPWYQVEQLLEQKANRVGICIKKREFCGGRNSRKSKPQKEKARRC